MRPPAERLLGAAGDVKEESERGGVLKILADDVIPANTTQERFVRLAGFSVLGTEIMTDQARLFRPESAAAALGYTEVILSSISAIERMKDTIWVNADLANVVISVSMALGDSTVDRVMGRLVGGLSISNALDAITSVAVTKYKASAMFRDIVNIMDDFRNDKRSFEATMSLIRQRAERNRDTLRLMNGAFFPVG